MMARIKGSEIVRLSVFLGKNRPRYVLLAVVNGVLSTGEQVTSAFALGTVVSAVQQQDTALLGTVVWLLVLGLAMRFISAFTSIPMHMYVDEMAAGIRQRMFRKIPKLPMAYYGENLSGDLMSRVTNDINVFQALFHEQVPALIYFLCEGVISIAVAVLVNWWMGLLLCAISIGFKLLNDYLVKAVKQYSEQAFAKNGELLQLLLNILSGQTVIKMFGLQDRMNAQYWAENQAYTKLSVRLAFHKSLQNACNSMMTSLASNVALVIGAYLVFGNTISLATLLILNQLAWLVTMVFRWAGQILAEATSTAIAGQRIADMLETPNEPERFACPQAGDVPYAVAFEDVTFCYGETPVLSGISFHVQSGKRLALVGESGGGKSTVIKLLLGFYDVQGGNIWVRGKSLSHYTRDQLRQMSAYVAQDSILFDNTIAENIRYGRPGASDAEVMEAARLAYAHDFILEQPDGYETLVGERAVKLSGGQRQRIAIARAILKDAPILLLDEATSALDAESQEKVQLALNSLMEGRTTIVVAHRLSTIEGADEILVLGGGRILQRGAHKALLAQGGPYADLYRLQYVRQGR